MTRYNSTATVDYCNAKLPRQASVIVVNDLPIGEKRTTYSPISREPYRRAKVVEKVSDFFATAASHRSSNPIVSLGTLAVRQALLATLCLLSGLWSDIALAQGPESGGMAPWSPAKPDAWIEKLKAEKIPGVTLSSIGVTKGGTPIPVLLSEEDLDLATKKTRILLVPLADDESKTLVDALRWFQSSEEARPWRQRYTLSVVPRLRPDRIDLRASKFPPAGPAYSNGENPEAAYLWRWIGMHAPDLVVELSYPAIKTKTFLLGVPPSKLMSLQSLEKLDIARPTEPEESGLIDQLVQTAPSGTGSIPAVSAVPAHEEPFLPKLLSALDKAKFQGPSPARRELQKRLDRSPLQVAQQLAEVYGRDLNSITYIPALAAIGQLRLAKLTSDDAPLASVKQIAIPYYSGEKPSKPTGDVAYAGHLIFAELADATTGDQRDRYVQLAQSAADAMLREDGSPDLKRLSSSQMSDAVFMSGPILARVGRLTGEKKYFAASAAHVLNMAKLDLRDDGLYRHSPLDEAAWGRGNGFPAVGLAMVLSDFPADHPQRAALLEIYQQHMHALAKHQDYTGAWHQVIDHEESYREFTCTCMIAFAMARGVQRGWLDREKFTPVVKHAWQAIRTRIAADGSLVDVCTGTGKQKNLRAYYDRTAILGRDARGGAMALLIATELANGKDLSPGE